MNESWYTAYIQSTGQIVACFTSDLTSLEANTPDGSVILDGRYDSRDGYISDGDFVPFPPKPSDRHVFDWTTKSWVDPRSLEDLKAGKWLEIKRSRDAAEYGGFTWDGSRFDSDPESQTKIIGAVQLASITGESFQIDWTLADNSVRTLNKQDMVGVGEALGSHVATQHVIGRQLRQQIENATTPEAVAAVTWPGTQ